MLSSFSSLLSSFKSSSRLYWKSVRLSKRLLAKSNISEVTCSPDPRPYAMVTVAEVQLNGLLDSGASISCLGKGALDTAKQMNLRVKPVLSSVKTADGANQQVLGFVDAPVTYNSVTKLIRLYLIPSLSQSLYLGIDFWQTFQICPAIVSEISPPLETDANTHLLDEQQSEQLCSVRQLFPTSDPHRLGKTSILYHSIDVGNAKPIKQRHYPVSPAIQKLMFDELDRMLELGVIEESQSPWNSPVVLVRKANGKSRLCLDSRAVNTVTVKDAYPMPMIDGIMSRLADTFFISSIDLKDAFWQIELDAKSREITAFTVPGRPHYQFRRMPFGLCNAAQTMCRLMDRVIPSVLREHVFVFIDDLLVVSPDFNSHLKSLKEVAVCLKNAGLTINVEKSKFCMKEIRYLGYIVGNGCLKTDPDKVQAVKNFPTPATVKQVRSFLGMTGWYQRFIPAYASLATPLTDLLGVKGKFTWTDEAQDSFDKLKLCLITAPVLSHPDFKKPFVIQCDASGTGVGSVLYQLSDDGLEHPIAYMSKKLNAAQRNYSVTELECLAAVLSLKKFRAYVEGMPFKVVTDHASLKWLMTQKDLAGRLARWSLKLQAFDFTIEHRKGSANIVPDALSRMYVDEISADVSPALTIDLESPHFLSDDYSAIKADIQSYSNRFPDIKVDAPHIFVRHFSRSTDNLDVGPFWRLWVPTELRQGLIMGAHDEPQSAHRGVGKTLERLKRHYFWPKMTKDIRDYVLNCSTCKEIKAPNFTLRPPMGLQVDVERPWQRVYVDFLGPYPRSKSGNVYLFVVLDKFTKFVLLKPMAKATASNSIKYIESELFHLFGVPESLLSDNGNQFRSKEFGSFLKRYGVTHITTATHSPQANASERVNRSILSAIRAYIDADHRDWDLRISAIGSALRNSVHDSTGFTPHYLLFGNHLVQHGSAFKLLRKLGALQEDCVNVLSPSDFKNLVHERVVDNLRQAHATHEKAYNTRSREVNFIVGQEVFRRVFAQSNFSKGFNAKLGKQWQKARIAKKQGTCMYILEDLQGNAIPFPYHAKDIRQ